jgi:hypothetical protein
MPLRPSVPEKQIIGLSPNFLPPWGQRYRYKLCRRIPPFSVPLSSRLARQTETLFQLALRKICQPPAGTARGQNKTKIPKEVAGALTRGLIALLEQVLSHYNAHLSCKL